MRAGKLRHRVTLQSLTAGSPQQTASGQPDESWADEATIWASVEPLRGRELFAAQEHHSRVEVRIRLRYRAGITAAMRVSFDGRYYNIVAVLDREERHRELELMCEQGVNNG
jgi:SPP1 family predicted phage head-tail adaptor